MRATGHSTPSVPLVPPAAGRHRAGPESAGPDRAIRIGVTGHRDIPPEARGRVRAGLADALDRCRGSRPLEALSALAAGADQMFAEAALDRGAALTAVLPAADYASTFAPGDAARFHHLVRRAHHRVVLDHAQVSDEAYYAAGLYIVEHSDLVLAVWDGFPARGRGGTAEIVDLARRRGRPVSVIWRPGVVRA